MCTMDIYERTSLLPKSDSVMEVFLLRLKDSE